MDHEELQACVPEPAATTTSEPSAAPSEPPAAAPSPASGPVNTEAATELFSHYAEGECRAPQQLTCEPPPAPAAFAPDNSLMEAVMTTIGWHPLVQNAAGIAHTGAAIDRLYHSDYPGTDEELGAAGRAFGSSLMSSVPGAVTRRALPGALGARYVALPRGEQQLLQKAVESPLSRAAKGDSGKYVSVDPATRDDDLVCK
jgi:hypothetical protein